MIIYGDLLFILNMTVDYILISLTLLFIKTDVSVLRQIIASVFGGLSAFYIFIESNILIVDLLFRLFVTAVIWMLLLGFRCGKKIFKAGSIYFVLSLLLSGIMIFIADTFSSNGIAVNNTFFYVGISPLVLIMVCVIFYFAVKIFYRVRKNYSGRHLCEIKVTLNDTDKQYFALIDSGNSVSDILTDSEILISSERVLNELTGLDINKIFTDQGFKKRCRLIPAGTVSGETILPAIRCDKAEIMCNENTYELRNPIIAVSKHIKTDDYDIIISQGVLEGR